MTYHVASINEIMKPSSTLFKVTRTSTTDSCSEGQPCVEAFKGYVAKIDRRNRAGHEGIVRNMGVESCWLIRIETLEELMVFIDKYDDCIISKDKSGFNCIEIYDTYRE